MNRAFPKKLQIPRSMVSGLVVLIVLIVSACTQSNSNAQNFTYKVKVQDSITQAAIPDAELSLELSGIAPLPNTTDTRGSAIFTIPSGYLKSAGRLYVEAKGYGKQNFNITVFENSSPDLISLQSLGSSIGASPVPSLPTTTILPPTVAVKQNPKTISCLVSAFGSYYPLLQVVHDGLDKKNGFNLEIVPLGLPNPDGSKSNDYENDELYEKIRSGESDCVLTTLDVFARFGNFGVITAIVDESAGADQVWASGNIHTINDLAGKRIAYEEGSASEFVVYALLDVVGLGASDVQLRPARNIYESISLFNEGAADAISAWEPNIIEDRKGGSLLVSSEEIRYVVDVIVFSKKAIETKNESVQAFHRAWFQALKDQFDDPANAANSIADWGGNDWTYINRATARNDLEGLLEHIAQG